MKEIWIPGSKSQSIRALLIAAFSRGESRIRNILFSSDTRSCMDAISKLGCILSYDEGLKLLTVDSSHLAEDIDKVEIDMGNSGTSTYLLMGLASSLGIPVTIYGDESLNSRPIRPLCEAYRALGAEVEDNDGYPPFTIKGPLRGGAVSIECRTSQYLSSLLLASMLSKGDVMIDCPLLYEKPYVKMTTRWLDDQGLSYFMSEDLEHSRIPGNQSYHPIDVTIGGDYSSASFFFALAAIKKEAIYIRGLDRNDSQGDKRVLEVLEEMGAEITWKEDGVVVRGPEALRGGEFDINDIPDALPILSAISPLAKEDVHLTNVPQARIKETDRIAVMRENLERLGARITEEEDGMIIHAGAPLHGGMVKGYEDHRIIMALSILGEVVQGIELDDTRKADVTFPTFFKLLEDTRG